MSSASTHSRSSRTAPSTSGGSSSDAAAKNEPSPSTPTRATLTAAASLVDWTLLDPLRREIGIMVSEGFTQAEIAERLDLPDSRVGSEVRALKRWILDQLSSRMDDLGQNLRRLVEERRGGTA